MHPFLILWRDRYLNKIKDVSKNDQNQRSVEMANCLFDTNKNLVILHGRHIYATASGMYIATMCAYSTSQHVFPHCKCVLRCCANCPPIDIPGQ